MNTSLKIFQLLEYKDFYGEKKHLNDAIKLIEDIPSVTLLNYISGFMIHGYLHDNDENTGKIQFELVNSLLNKCSEETRMLWVKTITKFKEEYVDPIFTWSLSNLHFYDLIFSNFNNLNSRDLKTSEAKNVFDTYLIINQQVNAQTTVEEEVNFDNKNEDEIKDFVVAKLMYQRDYMSSLDFRNQVQRGDAFFNYIKPHTKYSKLGAKYLLNKGVANFEEMFRTLLVIFTQSFGNGSNEGRRQLIDISESVKHNFINLDFIQSLCINSYINSYKIDISFLSIRNHFLYQVSQYKFILLNVNFLYDHFFNSHVFAFHNFIKKETKQSDFLSVKAKEFMEETYLPKVLNECFPNDITFFSNELESSDNTELCDGYIRRQDKLCLIEFKDVLLNARIKNSTSIEDIKTELDIKFKANQKGKSKGVTQLANALKKLEQGYDEIDADFASLNNPEIYPIIIYTDKSFGQEGLNAIYRKELNSQLADIPFENLLVKDLIFINLNFFEMRSHYFNNNNLDFYDMLDKYLEHIKTSENSLTSFEVFARHYTNKYNIIDLPEPDILSKYVLI